MEGARRRGRGPRECVILVLRIPPSILTFESLGTLKNDDAEDSDEEEGEDDVEAAAERQIVQKEGTKRPAAEKQPTGRIVGMVKRNWRS